MDNNQTNDQASNTDNANNKESKNQNQIDNKNNTPNPADNNQTDFTEETSDQSKTNNTQSNNQGNSSNPSQNNAVQQPSQIPPQQQPNQQQAKDNVQQNKESIEKFKVASILHKKIAIAIILIAIVGITASLLLNSYIYPPHKIITTSPPPSNKIPTNTVSPPPIKPVEFKSINNCRVLNESGNYTVNSPIATNISQGACININANNVTINCKGLNITGSGPFLNSPPFTYGIKIANKSNVTISKCSVKDFSYGVYSNNSSYVSIKNNNLSINFISELALINSHNVNVSNNHLFKSETYKGAVYISNNSSNITVKNNSILYNAFYGLNISSSRNKFINNYINGTPVSFYCSLNSSFPISSSAKSNICYNNTQCSFVTCAGFNKPANLSYINLSNIRNTAKTINECGSINNPGIYQLNNNINMSNFVNTSNPLVGFGLINSMHLRCININTNNVTINCKDHTISNSPVAIYADNELNVSVSNCKIINSESGIQFTNITSGNLTNINVSGSNVSVMLKNSRALYGSNLTLENSNIGLYLLSSSADSFNKLTILKNNIFGLFVNKSLGNIFTNGTIMNNSKVDVYANNNANKTSADLMQLTTCGVTDANWAPCKLHLSVSLAYVPITSCKAISRPGNYSLMNNLISNSSNCINVNANNVRLNCRNYSITGTQNMQSGIVIQNKTNLSITNVSINSCNINGFENAILVNNSLQVNLSDNILKSILFGIKINKASSILIKNNKIKYAASNTSIFLNKVNNSIILNNNASFGLPPSSTALLIQNSTNNIIENNSGINNNIGMYLESKSNNNTIINNTMLSNKQADYFCTSLNSNMSSENGGINYGNTKIICYWLAALSKVSPNPTCNLIGSGSLYSFTKDFVYPYNSTCYQIINSNDSTINCNDHTIIATKGGTFLSAKNASNIVIKNCYLKGFTNPIVVKNATIEVLNNTIYSNASKGIAINTSYSQSDQIKHNTIIGYLFGIKMVKDLNNILMNNNVNSQNAYIINKSTNIKISNNTSSNVSIYGLNLINSSTILLFNNTLLGKYGISCIASSQNASSNLDLGSNKYSSNQNCKWAK